MVPKTAPLVETTSRGLYCAAGDFYIDPWRPVKRALITHAHGDHLRPGNGSYFCARAGERLVRRRLSDEGDIRAVEYGEPLTFKSARISFHPAGHILGSAQIRIEARGKVWVVSGDYKRAPDPTCQPFEPIECDTFITEATFGYPVYRWDATPRVAEEVFEWWKLNREIGKTSILFCYSLGKAQRLLAELKAFTDWPVHTHGAVETLTQLYRDEGVALLSTIPVKETPEKTDFSGALVLAPPSAYGSSWLRRFRDVETGFASGWMRIRGNRRRRSYDRGFVLSDHADWPSLLQTIDETRARRVLVTHGASDVLVRYLREGGLDALPLETAYEGESEDAREVAS